MHKIGNLVVHSDRLYLKIPVSWSENLVVPMTPATTDALTKLLESGVVVQTEGYGKDYKLKRVDSAGEPYSMRVDVVSGHALVTGIRNMDPPEPANDEGNAVPLAAE
jgi:hypothetical protein